MKKVNKSVKESCGKFIVAKKNNQYYRIYLKDLKCIKMRTKKLLPQVPAFNREEVEEKNREMITEVETEDSCQNMEE